MAVYVERSLKNNNVELKLGKVVESFTGRETGLNVHYSDGGILETDIVLLANGVQPESSLARNVNLNLGERGGIQVNETMQTNDSAIYAVGDVVEVKDLVTGQAISLPLAGPANRQGRIAAGSVLKYLNNDNRKILKFRGVQGTAVCQVFGQTIAITGANEKTLQKNGIDNYRAIYLHPGNHVRYYPGAKPIHMKLIFTQDDGRILGVQAIGTSGVARRVDVIAMAMQMGGTVYDLEESELCYAPQFGAAKDPVNMAGMIAGNNLRADLPLADWRSLQDCECFVLDVRSANEFSGEKITGAVNIPIEKLCDRYTELPKDTEIMVVCGVGQRAYYAVRMLLQYGYQVKMLPGGMQTYQVIKDIKKG